MKLADIDVKITTIEVNVHYRAVKITNTVSETDKKCCRAAVKCS